MWLNSKTDSPTSELAHSSDNGQLISRQQRSSSPPLHGGCEALSDLSFDCQIDNEDEILLNNEKLPNAFDKGLQIRNKRDSLTDFAASIDAPPPNKSYINILEKELNPRNSFTQNFLQSIISSLDSKDPVVANAWLETLLDVIDLLPKEVIKNDILNVVISKGQLSQPISSRLSCCKMLGKICTKFEPYLIKKEILPLVQSLCQDTDYEVRGCMCRQLDAVARGMGFDAAKTSILPELVELANDEETCVRLAGIETVVNLLPLFDDETCAQIIVPLVKKYCQNSLSSQDATLPVLSFNLGRLCHGLSANLSMKNKQWFIDYFRQLAKLGLPEDTDVVKPPSNNDVNPMPDLVPLVDTREKHRECRQNCAYNFPGMVLFAGLHHFQSSLYKSFSMLCSDPCFLVRQTIASGFHEVAKLLGPKVDDISKELVTLLTDTSIEVLRGLVPHLPDTLGAFAKESPIGSGLNPSHVESISSALVECEMIASQTSNWRLHCTFLDKMSCLTWCLDSQVIYNVFVPLFCSKIRTAHAIPCRIAAARTLLTFLKLNQCVEQRDSICSKLSTELCHGRSCHSRSMFIDVCFLALHLFSKSFFKQHFYKDLLTLAADKVVNIRLRLCSILPQMKSVIKLPDDSELLQQLELCVRQLMATETDRDVSDAVQNAIIELDKIEVMVDSMHISQGTLFEEDEDDMKKEEEELLIEMQSVKKGDENKDAFVQRKCVGRIPIRKSETASKPPSRMKLSKSSIALGAGLGSDKGCKSAEEKSEERSDVSLPKFVRTKMKSSQSSSAISANVVASRRCSTGSLSRIPSPCSSPLPRRPSYDNLSSCRVSSPTNTPRQSSLSKIPSFVSSPIPQRAAQSRISDDQSTSSQNSKQANSRIPCLSNRK